VGETKALTRTNKIKLCSSGNHDIVVVLFDSASPNDFTLVGVKAGGPVTVTIVFVVGKPEFITVKVVPAPTPTPTP
jgi:hypothetical protein